ncbi:hypothetical protein IH879_15170, partial [candidate division KSB1 bacterium]|nr:hypothetical protein [candidate division KSB1 bacterium]
KETETILIVTDKNKLDIANSIKEAAEKIADYSINSLYDAYSGGFFERNSKDIDLYAEDELILTDKAAQENGIIIFALSKLYTHNGNLLYLNAAIKSFGNMMGSISQHDRGY